MSLSLAEKPNETIAQRATRAAARILDLCHTLEGIRDDFIPLLPELVDNKVIAVRMGAKIVGVWAWVVECACDAEMLNRVEKRTGRKDESATHDGFTEGREAAKRQQAYLDGKSTRSIERNAQIINTFSLETITMHGGTLQDKGFWIAAVGAPDPLEAIEIFAEKKAENPFMEVQDAYREIDAIKGKHREAKNQFVAKFRSVSRKIVGEWIEFTARAAIAALKVSCPDPRLLRVFDEMDQQLQERAEVMLIEDAEPALILAWEKGYRTEKLMEDFTGLLPLEIRTTMLSLQEKGYFVEQNLQWKTPRGRGSRPKEWQRTSKPLPAIHVVPPAA